MMYPKPVRVHRKRIAISRAQTERLLARAGGRCERCHKLPDFRGLQKSHITPKGMGGTKEEYLDSELEVLCGVCHDSDHGIRDVL